jgi:uncharacterized protein YndB with AHSA1/START domain
VTDAEAAEATEERLQFVHLVPAPRGRVFRAWTSRDELEAWFGPPSKRVRVVELDARPGGRFRIDLHEPGDAGVLTVTGAYLEVRPPERLVFTWAWLSDGVPGPESRVVVEFRDRGHDTEVFLLHEGLPGLEEVQHHLDGWRHSVVRLAAHVRRRDAGP